MLNSFRYVSITAGLVVAATILGAGVSSAADNVVSLTFSNVMDTQEAVLEVTDSNSTYSPGTKSIHLSAPTNKGKPTLLASTAPFKVEVDKKGNANLKVTAHCGSSTDSATYTRPPSTIQITSGCRLTRS
jgi:hypothetical protein